MRVVNFKLKNQLRHSLFIHSSNTFIFIDTLHKYNSVGSIFYGELLDEDT